MHSPSMSEVPVPGCRGMDWTQELCPKGEFNFYLSSSPELAASDEQSLDEEYIPLKMENKTCRKVMPVISKPSRSTTPRIASSRSVELQMRCSCVVERLELQY